MPTPLRVLIVEDVLDDAELMILRLTAEGFQPDWMRVQTEGEYLAALQATPDLILADWSLPQFNGLAALQLLHQRGLDIPFIIVSGGIGEEAAIDALRQGAHDYVLKDRLGRLGQAVRHALEEKRLREEGRRAEQRIRQLSRAVEQSPVSIVITDTAGNIEYINPKFTQITGYTFEEVLGKNPRLLKTGHTPAAEYKRLWDTITAGDEWRGEFLDRKKDGEVYWEYAVISPITNAEGVITHFLAVKEDITARKQTEDALRDKVAALQTLAEIDREISAASELKVILDLVCHRAADLLRVPKSAITLQVSTNEIGLAASDGLRDPQRADKEFVGFWQAGIMRRNDLHSYDVVSQADIPADTPYMPEFRAREEVRAFALAPLVAGEQMLGTLLIFDTVPHPWSADEVQLLGLLAGQAAIGIEKARLYDAVSQEKARLELLYGLSQQVSTSLDVRHVAQQALDQICRVLGARYGVLLMHEPDGERLRPAAASGYGEESVEALDQRLGRVMSDGLEGWVAAHRQSALSGDVTEDARWLSTPETDNGVRSALSVPLIIRGELLGVFTISSDREAFFNAEHLKLAESVAAVVAVALSNARLYQGEREQRALAEALRDTAAALVSTLDFDQVLDRILTYVGHVVAHDAGTILLVEQGIAAIARSRGYAERGLASVGEIWFPVAERANLRSMAESGRPLVILDTRAYPDWVDLPETHWIRSYVAAPIQVKGQVVGFINLDSAVPGAFTQTHAEHLQAFADQAAIAIENAELYSSLQESNQQLRKALRAKDEMIQNVSHELRTPLAILTGYAELLETADFGALTSEQEQAIQIIHQQGDQLRFMVDQLLALQAFNARAMQRIELDMEAWLQRTLRPWAARAALRELAVDLRIRLEIEPGLPCVLADPQLLAQVIDNLLANAVKFSPAGGEVRVRAWADAGEVIIAVSDAGIGIPPDKLDQVFERFYQVDGGATRQFRGLGIGLALCRTIVEAHGGRIWAESAGVGQGSTFYVALPARSAQP